MSLGKYRLTIALVLGVAAIALAIFTNAHSAGQACTAALKVRDATRDVIVLARDAPTPGRPPAQAAAAETFYGRSVARLDAVRC